MGFAFLSVCPHGLCLGSWIKGKEAIYMLVMTLIIVLSHRQKLLFLIFLVQEVLHQVPAVKLFLITLR